MAEWTHRMCGECWLVQEGELADARAADHAANHDDDDDTVEAIRFTIRRPVTVRHAAVGTCCFCKGRTFLGIYTRHDPAQLHCADQHEEDGD